MDLSFFCTLNTSTALSCISLVQFVCCVLVSQIGVLYTTISLYSLFHNAFCYCLFPPYQSLSQLGGGGGGNNNKLVSNDKGCFDGGGPGAYINNV